MSCQRGNFCRTRAQKHKNRTAFKNDLHDKSSKTKFINSIEVVNVCERCKKIIEWKIKYKKYKPLKTPGTCTKCQEKTVRHTYHIMCLPCAKKHGVCPKCNEKAPVIEGKPSQEECMKLDMELQTLLKKLPERKRRTFVRYMNRKARGNKNDVKNVSEDNETNSVHSEQETTKETDTNTSVTEEDLLTKLKLLVMKEGKSDSFDEFSEDDNENEYSDSDEDTDNLTM